MRVRERRGPSGGTETDADRRAQGSVRRGGVCGVLGIGDAGEGEGAEAVRGRVQATVLPREACGAERPDELEQVPGL